MVHELSHYYKALETRNRAEMIRLARLAGLRVADDEDFTDRLKEFESAIKDYQEAGEADAD